MWNLKILCFIIEKTAREDIFVKIGILSDTHDLLREDVIRQLQGCDLILHGGDISSRKILDRLEEIAPVKAVRGNNDKEWAEELPVFLDFELGGLRIYMTHKKKDLPGNQDPYDLLIYGHSHQYGAVWRERQGGKRARLLNPGSCGPRRFYQPVTMAVLQTDRDGFTVERFELAHSPGETVLKADSKKDLRKQIETVIRETQKGKAVKDIAKKTGMDEALAEQIARLYVTHPGVTADGIMTKMGL